MVCADADSSQNSGHTYKTNEQITAVVGYFQTPTRVPDGHLAMYCPIVVVELEEIILKSDTF